jgi:hypothetical protein
VLDLWIVADERVNICILLEQTSCLQRHYASVLTILLQYPLSHYTDRYDAALGVQVSVRSKSFRFKT